MSRSRSDFFRNAALKLLSLQCQFGDIGALIFMTIALVDSFPKRFSAVQRQVVCESLFDLMLLIPYISHERVLHYQKR